MRLRDKLGRWVSSGWTKIDAADAAAVLSGNYVIPGGSRVRSGHGEKNVLPGHGENDVVPVSSHGEGQPVETTEIDWSRIALAATALTDRLDGRLGKQDDSRLRELAARGYAAHEIDAIRGLSAARGIEDPREAAWTYDVGRPLKGSVDPAMGLQRLSTERGGMSPRDPREAERDRAAFEALLVSNDEEGFLRVMVPGALRQIRHEMRNWRF
jgi:hypothetical protein